MRLLAKALRLCPALGPQVRGQLRAAEETLAARAGSGAGAGAAGAAPDGVRRRPAGAGAGAGAVSPPADLRPVTPEMVEVVKAVRGAKDLYAVLGVARDADENAISRAYKKLALKVHPDKNTAPGADEAFKRGGRAYSTLNDAQERASYDRTGEENGVAAAGAGGGGGGMRGGVHRGGGFGGGGGGGGGVGMRPGEMSAEDIFNTFFAGGLGGGAGIFQGPDGRFHMRTGGGGPPRGPRGARQQAQGDPDGYEQHEAMQGGLAVRLQQMWPMRVTKWPGGSDARGRSCACAVLRRTRVSTPAATASDLAIPLSSQPARAGSCCCFLR